ncbi:phosphatidylserine/phosphatidylglycerophosphate/cardiolipin synthase family protein [Persicobacter sp. CCB-QB2]|uniref:phospholipase D-like domain-containing protein n=1 Tax=Persicobacter sp. CCB-QB2 TaxID=1561025 RepID=UPI0006A9F948|nr:phospholipase D-like domain-containing protein [Persicobacter sp. CCB-QB2]
MNFQKLPIALVLLFFLISCDADLLEKDYPDGPKFEADLPLLILPGAEELQARTNAIENHLMAFIQAVPEGEDLYVNMFKFSSGSLRNALLEAKDRGVQVKVMLDIDEVNSYTRKVLQDSLAFFYSFNNTLDAKAVNHHKYLLASALRTPHGVAQKVSVVTSYNFTVGDNAKYQDCLWLEDDRLYDVLEDNFHQMHQASLAWELPQWNFSWTEVGQGQVGFFPKQDGADVAEDIFRDIQPGDIVRIANSKWEDDRPGLKKALGELLESGVILKVMAPALRTDNIDQAWVDQLNEWAERYLNFEVKWVSSPALHNKNIIIERAAGASEIWTGAHNFRRRSLVYNFELLLSHQQPEIVAQYVDWFEEEFLRH